MLRAAWTLGLMLAVARADQVASDVTPIQKVVQLLESMLQKGKDELKGEDVQFAKFKMFCTDTVASKEKAIAEEKQQIEILKADIEKATSDIDMLVQDLAQIEHDIGIWSGDIVAARKVRDLEKGHHTDMLADYQETLDAIAEATKVLQDKAKDHPQAQSLGQISSLTSLRLIPVDAKKQIRVLLSQESPSAQQSNVTAPEANAYEFQSHGIIAILGELHDKFRDEKTALEKEESNDAHQFTMLNEMLTAQLEHAKKESTSKVQSKQKKEEDKAGWEGDLTALAEVLASDEKYTSDLKVTCEQKAADFEARFSLRTEEIEALQKAIAIISSVSHQDSTKMLPTEAVVFAQFRSVEINPAQKRVAEYLSKQGQKLNSRLLAVLSEKVAEDPFKKVKKMIKDLVVRLMDEANQETEHKAWCDGELTTNLQTRTDKSEAIEMLHAEVDELESSIALLTEEISKDTTAVADLDVAMAKASAMRTTEKEHNAAILEDALEAQTALAQAKTVLREFYAKAAVSTSFVQHRVPPEQPTAPETFDGSYKGMQVEGGGVVDIILMLEEDFNRLELAVKESEATAQKEYDDMTTDSRVAKAEKLKDIEHESAKKQGKEHSLTTQQADLEGVQKELNAAMYYFDKLKPSCIDSGESYEDRVQRRKDEIDSLQTAVRILNSADVDIEDPLK